METINASTQCFDLENDLLLTDNSRATRMAINEVRELKKNLIAIVWQQNANLPNHFSIA